jgi:hypothetical protein
MLIVLPNRQEGKDMPDHVNTAITHTAPQPEDIEHAQNKARHAPSPSQVSAVVEAAYILEAVRK